MSLVIARIADNIGMQKVAEKIVRRTYGEQFGKVSKSGLRAFTYEHDNGTKVVTTIDKHYRLYSQMMHSKSGDIFCKLVYDSLGNTYKGTKCINLGDKIYHKEIEPKKKTIGYKEWFYDKQTKQKTVVIEEDRSKYFVI